MEYKQSIIEVINYIKKKLFKEDVNLNIQMPSHCINIKIIITYILIKILKISNYFAAYQLYNMLNEFWRKRKNDDSCGAQVYVLINRGKAEY